MFDKNRYKKELILELLLRPANAIPTLSGLTLAVLALLASKGLAVLLFLTSITFCAGMFLTGLIKGDGSKIAKKVAAKLMKEAEEEAAQMLDGLDWRLSSDGDRRTQTCLRDLRALLDAIKDTNCPDELLVIEMIHGAEKIFEECVKRLDNTLNLLELSRTLKDTEAKKEVESQREIIIADIQESVTALSKVVAKLHAADDVESAANLRKELEENLKIYETINAKLTGQDKNSKKVEDKYLEAYEKSKSLESNESEEVEWKENSEERIRLRNSNS